MRDITRGRGPSRVRRHVVRLGALLVVVPVSSVVLAGTSHADGEAIPPPCRVTDRPGAAVDLPSLTVTVDGSFAVECF